VDDFVFGRSEQFHSTVVMKAFLLLLVRKNPAALKFLVFRFV